VLLLTSALAGGVVIGGLVIVRRQIAIISVTGQSMEPTLADGDRVIVRRTRLRSVRAGRLVVFEAPSDDEGGWTNSQPGRSLNRVWLIKRAAAVPGDPLPAGLPARLAGDLTVPDGKLVVLGDNPASSVDSRLLGYIPGDRLLGVVVGSPPDGALPGTYSDRNSPIRMKSFHPSGYSSASRRTPSWRKPQAT
jgi:signal peptidase I